MKKVLKFIGIGVGAIVVLALIGLLTLALKPLPSYQEDVIIPSLQVEVTPDRVQRGMELATVLCNHCHRANENSLTGKVMEANTALGPIIAPNITKDPVHGIGKYSDGELYRLLRTGVKKNGELALPMMMRFPHAADEDVYAIIAMLKSNDPLVQPQKSVLPEPAPSLLAKALFTFGAFSPLPYPSEEIELPTPEPTADYGKYLTNSILMCYDCHSQSFETNNILNPEASAGFLAGGNPIKLPDYPLAVSANITMNEADGIGTWSVNQFISAVKWGRKIDGTSVQYPMMPYTFLDTVEIVSIYEYLKTVPAIKTVKLAQSE